MRIGILGAGRIGGGLARRLAPVGHEVMLAGREATHDLAPVLEVENSESAAAELHKLPLVAAGLFRGEIIELRPFVNWSRLLI